MQKKTIFRLGALMLALVLMISSLSGIASYFTDTDAATNTFKIGEVDIELKEPHWPGITDTNPNQTTNKDPQIYNSGVSDAYVYLEVLVPCQDDLVTVNPDGTRNDAARTELFTYTINPGWIEIPSGSEPADGVVKHVYAYVSDDPQNMEILSAGETTPTLFDEITFVNAVENQGLENRDLDVIVNAYAIQANDLNGGKTDPRGVWEVIANSGIADKNESDGNENEDDDNYIGFVSTDNTITLNGVEAAGTYTLRYANADGVLTDYADICSLEVTDPVAAVSYDDLIAENCAPVEATTIAVYDANNNKVGDIALGYLDANLGAKLYSFGALADTHVNDDDNTKMQNALSYLSSTANVSFTCVPGDLTDACSDAQWAMWSNIVDTCSANTPVYTATGNHDTPFWTGMDPEYLTEYTDLKTTIEEATGNPLYYSFTQGDDVFIMVGVQSNMDSNPFTHEELQWLYETLEANRNKRCFVFQHALTASGSGDANDWYSNGSWVLEGTQKEVFESLVEHYSNVTWFHGHSHQAFEMQSQVDSATYLKTYNSHSVHIPSATYTRGPAYTAKSEGYVVDVYERGIVLKGVDFDNDVLLPIAHYYLDTTLKSVEANTYVDETATINCPKAEIEWTYATHVDKTTGAVVSRDDYATTNLIPVDSDKSIYYHAVAGSYSGFDLCCYDGEGNYLGFTVVPFSQSNLWSAPVELNGSLKENTEFIRLRMYFYNQESFYKFTPSIHITFK